MQYDDRERSYVEAFPWFQLRLLVEQKLDALQVNLAPADREVNEPRGDGCSLSSGPAPLAVANEIVETDRRNAG